MAKVKSKVDIEKKTKLQKALVQKKKRSEVNSKVLKSGKSKVLQDAVKTTNNLKKKILDTSLIETSCQVKSVQNITKKDFTTLSKKAKIVNSKQSDACVNNKKVRGSSSVLKSEQKKNNTKSSLNSLKFKKNKIPSRVSTSLEDKTLDDSKNSKIPKIGKRKNNEPSNPKGKACTEPSIVAKKIKKADEPKDSCNKVTKEDVITALLQLEKEDKKNKSVKKKEKQKNSVKTKEGNVKDSSQKNEKRNKNVNSSQKNPLVKIQKQKITVNGAPSTVTTANKKNPKGKKFKKVNQETTLEQKLVKKNKKHPKSKLKAKSESVSYEPVDFDEDKFNAIVNLDNITKVVEGFKTLIDTDVSKKKTQIFTDFKYMLNITCFKIANSPKRMVKLKLQHPLAGEDEDVLLIVADLQRGAKVDYTPTIQHYEDLLRGNDIKGITVMPFNQFRQEYRSYEMLRKLGNMYDYFLCDSRIIRHVSGIARSIFQTTRRTLHAVRMTDEGKVKSEIAKALRSTAYKNFSKGNISTIPVGTNKFPARKLAENILTVVEYLKKNYPGGHPNIRNMMLRINISGISALPIYVSTGNGPDETPYVVGEREQRMIELKKSANEILSKFHLTKEGKISKLTNEAVQNKMKIKAAKADLSEKTTSSEKTKRLNLIEKPKKGKENVEMQKTKNVEKKLNERNLKQNGDSSSQWEALNENEFDTSKDDENKNKEEQSNIKSKEKKSKGVFSKQNLQCESLDVSDQEQEGENDIDESCDEVEDYHEEGSDENDDSGYIRNEDDDKDDVNDESGDDDDDDDDDDEGDQDDDDEGEEDDDENDDDG